MVSKAGLFFAGIGTTFVILGAGFGSGLMLANSALKDPNGYQARVKEVPSPIRVILPTPAEAAPAPQPVQQASAPAPQPTVHAPEPVQKIEKPDARKVESDRRERRKRVAERKVQRHAAPARHKPTEAPVMAFGADEPPRTGGYSMYTNDER